MLLHHYLLHEYFFDAFIGGVTFQDKGFIKLWHSEYYGFTHNILQILEGPVCSVISTESIFLSTIVGGAIILP
jgi:hypothetical protein